MAGCLVGFLVIGLELMCVAVGMALPDSGAPAYVHTVWILALASIPVTGFGAVLSAGNKRLGRSAARVVAIVGAALALLWGWVGVVSKFDVSRFAAGLMASMAFMSALLLVSAGIWRLKRTAETESSLGGPVA